MKELKLMKPGEEVLDCIPAHEICSIESTADGRKLIRTHGGGVWLTLTKRCEFELQELELRLKAHFQQMVEVTEKVRTRIHRPAVRC